MGWNPFWKGNSVLKHQLLVLVHVNYQSQITEARKYNNKGPDNMAKMTLAVVKVIYLK